MHLAEGIMPPAILLGGWIITSAGTVFGMRRAGYDRLGLAASLAAVFFVGSLVHVPLGPGNVHLVLNGLVGLLLGWTAFPVFLLALLLQAVLFQYGGLAVLGVNTLNMALPAVCFGLVLRRLVASSGKRRALGAFLAGALPVAGSALMTAGLLAWAESGFYAAAVMMLGVHVPVIILEGIITLFVVTFLAKNRPELLVLS